jgi:uncharacterized membrane protein YbhN (UPF0104 family)
MQRRVLDCLHIDWHRLDRKLWLTFKAVYYSLFGLTLFVTCLYLWINRSSLAIAFNIASFRIVIPVITYFAMLIVRGLSFDTLAQVYGVRVDLIDSVGLTAWGGLSNYAVPGNAALPLRTLYLHRVLGLHYQDFLPLALVAFVFSTGLYGVLLGITALYYGIEPSPEYGRVILTFSGAGMALMLAAFIPYQSMSFLGTWVRHILAGWRMLYRSRMLFGKWLSLELLRAVLEMTFFYSIFTILGIQLTLIQTAITVLARETTIFLRVTPGAFGIAEGVQVFFATQFGADPASVLAAAIVARAIELVCLGVTSSVLMRRLSRRLTTNDQEPRSSHIQGAPSAQSIV